METEAGRIYLKVKPEDFNRAFLVAASEEVAKSLNKNDEFIINNHNKEVINQVYYYLTGSLKFEGNPKKGLLLAGGFGTGKTTILKAVVRIIEYYTPLRFRFIPCVEMATEIKTLGVKFFETRPIILDEIGRESKTIKDYGTKIRPIQEILAMRYNSRAWTLGTTNFNTQTLAEFYGGYIEDRLKEMFNIIEVKGESFRKNDN